jgi:hypothetical protein
LTQLSPSTLCSYRQSIERLSLSLILTVVNFASRVTQHQRNFPFCTSSTASSRNETKTHQSSSRRRKDTDTCYCKKKRTPKGLEIGLYYCFFSPERGFQSASSRHLHSIHHPPSPSPCAFNLLPPTQTCRSFVESCLLVFIINTFPAPFPTSILFSTTPVQAHALSLHSIINTSTFSFEDPLVYITINPNLFSTSSSSPTTFPIK